MAQPERLHFRRRRISRPRRLLRSAMAFPESCLDGRVCTASTLQAVRASDIPLAQDCFGDQYLLREGYVVRLYGETGEIKELRMGWNEFSGHIDAGPLEFLELQHLHRFKGEGGILLPGQLLSVYPPFVASYEGDRSMRAIPSLELISWLADFARQIADVPDGGRIRIKVLKESGNASKV
jgi:hypothetical protein